MPYTLIGKAHGIDYRLPVTVGESVAPDWKHPRNRTVPIMMRDIGYPVTDGQAHAFVWSKPDRLEHAFAQMADGWCRESGDAAAEAIIVKES